MYNSETQFFYLKRDFIFNGDFAMISKMSNTDHTAHNILNLFQNYLFCLKGLHIIFLYDEINQEMDVFVSKMAFIYR